VIHARVLHAPWDAVPVALSGVLGAALLAWPSAPLVALSVWWGSNTIGHLFIHRPFFAAPWANRLFSAWLSVVVGMPQTLWRERHLSHHAGARWTPRLSAPLLLETALVLGLWAALPPAFLVGVWLPGWLGGLALCWLQGHFEHHRGTVSHYGGLYNLLFFNDGYHVEHHAFPGLHWRALPGRRARGARASRWPAVLRWLDLLTLESLERRAARSGRLRRFLVRSHERAFRALLARLGAPPRRVAIVGGGLFPRTALVLRRLLPGARLTVIDRSAAHLEEARPWLDGAVEWVHGAFDPERHAGFDLVVVPLAYRGDREALYRRPPAPALIVHDWLWRRRGAGAVVSGLLLKRLNLVAA